MTSSSVVDSQSIPKQLVLATVDGQPWLDIPDDLYIPPDALEVILERFEGPLDLLLYLIRRQKLNIVELPVVEITRQYMSYVSTMAVLKLELAAEYLVMAALLAEIKSRMLLPKPPSEDEEEQDPRAELIRRLQEYELYKNTAQKVDELPRIDRNIYLAKVAKSESMPTAVIHPDVDLAELIAAFAGVVERAQQFEHHEVSRQQLSTRERMSDILSVLKVGVLTDFQSFFIPEEGRMGVIVTFMAILELTKNRLIRCLQSQPLAPIQVTLYEQPSESDEEFN
ncbi:segregation and condensation protein A [Celerinatantimonas diazotrophica]|uniref:Segregation and condensation protein A n=1 Tax=Celerinatantimonas diazotrophica TaxID=412034 RepID=A0A4R1JAG8_9GAMM|nr:ScpA family protein [Celerinatantimonas diazotrophica]TCK47530.1 condensin subunit ScpA [Celerinatantimonas diazotrophica]CAG9296852.1 Segregation and condensation protein A [Celerinatantimonas diazotrophica]